MAIARGRAAGAALAGLLLSAPALARAETADVLEEKESDSTESDQGESSSAGDDGDWDEEGGGSMESALHFGLRTGWGVPLGKVMDAPGADLNGAIYGQIPIWVDLGWQATPALMVGGYFSYGFGVLKTADAAGDPGCPQDANCRVADMRLGLQAQYSFAPRRSTDPWLGIGAGYEWLDSVQNDQTATVRGFEYLMLQGGLDFGGDSGTVVGPFVAYTIGTFDKSRLDTNSSSATADIPETASHSWLFLGVRGALK